MIDVLSEHYQASRGCMKTYNTKEPNDRPAPEYRLGQLLTRSELVSKCK